MSTKRCTRCSHRVFKRYRVVNPETEFLNVQISQLKKIYDDELAADKLFEVDEDANYLKDFQEFDKPPIVPEHVAQTEFYRPNPAAFQKRMNDNPYAVDVGFSSLENPIFSKMDDFPARMNIRANSEFYNPQDRLNKREDYLVPAKPFVQNLNMKIYEKNLLHNKLDDLIMKTSPGYSKTIPTVTERPGTTNSVQRMDSPKRQDDRRYDMYDLLREPEQVAADDTELPAHQRGALHESCCEHGDHQVQHRKAWGHRVHRRE